MSRVESPPDPKASSGLAGVFRNLGRLKSSATASSSNTAATSSLSNALYPNHQLYQPQSNLRLQNSQSPLPDTSLTDGSGQGSGSTDVSGVLSATGGSIHSHHLLLQLKHGNPLPMRINAAATVSTVIVEYPVSSVSTLWLAGQDLADIQNPPEARHVAFKLLLACISQSEGSSLDRITYFQAIANNHSANDFELQLEALVALTYNGKDLIAFERDIQPLLSRWLKTWFREATAARQARKRDNFPSATLSAAENNLQQLFSFLISVIKFSFKTFQEKELVPLLNDVLSICKKTTSKEDITRSLMFIDALITYGYIPKASLTPCIEVLCGAYATIRDLTEAIWNAVSNLCKSYMAHNSILALRAILESPVRKQSQFNTNTLRGAVCFFERLLLGSDEGGLPALQISTVMTAYHAALAANNPRLELDISRAICNIISKKEIASQIAFDEWTLPLEIIYECALSANERLLLATAVTELPNKKDHVVTALFQSINLIILQLEKLCSSVDFSSTEIVMEFFVKINQHLPDNCAELVINYFATEHLCYPSCSAWLTNSRKLVDIFFRNTSRPYHMRISILSLIKDVYETIKDVCDEQSLHTLILAIFEDIAGERDFKVLEALVRVAIDISKDAGISLFDKVFGLMVSALESNTTDPSTRRSSIEQVEGIKVLIPTNNNIGSFASVLVKGFVWIFTQNLHSCSVRCVSVYDELVKVATSSLYDLDARLAALKFLLRIRADSDHAVYLVQDTESESLAVLFGRMNRFAEDQYSKNETTEASNGSLGRSSRNPVQASLPRTQSRSNMEKFERSDNRLPLWTYPEVRPFPEEMSSDSSHQVFASSNIVDPETPNTLQERRVLSLSRWLEMVNTIIGNGSDYEVYSYIMVHFPSQLCNKTLFTDCKRQIQHLRLIICEQLHSNKIPNMEMPLEVKKADLAVALVHTLTILIAYHEHFSKADQEAIVKAFQLGLHSWQRTAKPCIHALSICSFELPLATSKFLPGILAKLSQIITSSAVSVHILEFLSLLAHLPAMTINFTEPDFRNVFGVAFRYIQHTKETTNSNRSMPNVKNIDKGANSEINAVQQIQDQPQIPQYVLTLAYNVISTWFLSLKLNDRSKYVTWITRGLILGDGSNKDILDEQSQASIDMLRRFTYADQDSKINVKALPATTISNNSKSWLLGSKIITINTLTASGQSQVIVRQPSGSSSFNLSLDSQQAQSLIQGSSATDIAGSGSARDDERTNGRSHILETSRQPAVMPSHVLMQLTTDVSLDMSRPVLLPEDEQTTRAINVFDRIPVVDFHKIGVVYVGAGQTTETEILSNVMGSSDYTDFVDKLGQLIVLKAITINTGGLDRENNIDGEFAFYWSDKITQIIFHVTTMMPTDRIHDPQCTNKKRHIGNDFVTIVFNNSGLPYRFDTIAAQFNFVNIVITPEAKTGFVATRLKNYDDSNRQFYRVQLLCKTGLPDISPAAEAKMISGKNLSAFVRNLALNASVFAQVYNEGGNDFVGNWRHRLRAINRLRERLGVPVSPGSRASDYRRISLAASVGSSVEADIQGNELDGLLENVDFSKWT